ncbi:hypothetical protein [Bacteroides sp.]|uniref:hypothetical protein n=1 Tax=Bacteroides sp. TaxID=29523 RepID=UPI0026107569|nr:hypothetical protein [Bacteroides sp.]MDD3039007.1 hypothetical protein [Bacteroides sp.]
MYKIEYKWNLFTGSYTACIKTADKRKTIFNSMLITASKHHKVKDPDTGEPLFLIYVTNTNLANLTGFIFADISTT